MFTNVIDGYIVFMVSRGQTYGMGFRWELDTDCIITVGYLPILCRRSRKSPDLFSVFILTAASLPAVSQGGNYPFDVSRLGDIHPNVSRYGLSFRCFAMADLRMLRDGEITIKCFAMWGYPFACFERVSPPLNVSRVGNYTFA